MLRAWIKTTEKAIRRTQVNLNKLHNTSLTDLDFYGLDKKRYGHDTLVEDEQRILDLLEQCKENPNGHTHPRFRNNNRKISQKEG